MDGAAKMVPVPLRWEQQRLAVEHVGTRLTTIKTRSAPACEEDFKL